MINQTAKKILKALSFDGVEVEAFRHMADLKRLDPMKTRKYITEVMQFQFEYFFQARKAFEKLKKRSMIFRIKNCFCSYMAVDGLQKVLIIMKEFALGLRMQPDNM